MNRALARPSASATVTAWREREASLSALALYPRIHLSKCYLCSGRGVIRIRDRRRILETQCANCAGSGTIASEA